MWGEVEWSWSKPNALNKIDTLNNVGSNFYRGTKAKEIDELLLSKIILRNQILTLELKDFKKIKYFTSASAKFILSAHKMIPLHYRCIFKNVKRHCIGLFVIYLVN